MTGWGSVDCCDIDCFLCVRSSLYCRRRMDGSNPSADVWDDSAPCTVLAVAEYSTRMFLGFPGWLRASSISPGEKSMCATTATCRHIGESHIGKRTSTRTEYGASIVESRGLDRIIIACIACAKAGHFTTASVGCCIKLLHATPYTKHQ